MTDSTEAAVASPESPGRRGEVLAWAMYDWANSAYSTLSITILVYYIKAVVLPGDLGTIVWAWGIALSMLTAALLSPILGALADANASKRRWLAGTAFAGATSAVILALIPPELPWLVVALFVVTALFFELSLGFYNGFLPEIAGDAEMNRVSARGFALGYIGGAAALALAMLLVKVGPAIGLSGLSSQLRGGILILGLWWGLFTVPAVWVLRDRARPPAEKKPLPTAVRAAVGEVGQTLRQIGRYQMLAFFLLAFLFYNDGIQSVISQSSNFAIEVLDFQAGELMLFVLVIQLTAFPGALLVGRLADAMGQKRTLNLCLGIWVALVVTAYFINAKWQLWVLGLVLALVLGGTQSVSRAMMGRMTPPKRTAEFFGFFNLSGKATSFLGVFLYGLIVMLTGDSRLAVLSLLIFFLIGWAFVSRVDVEQGRRDALDN